MSLENILEQEWAKAYLKRALAEERLKGSFLFSGPLGTGKFATACEIAQALLCEKPGGEKEACGKCGSCLKVRQFSHPDFFLLFPHPGSEKPKEVEEYRQEFISTKLEDPYRIVEYTKPVNISRDAVRRLKENIYRSPYQADRKVVLLEQVESMRADSTNLLLKIFEEPPADTVIILTTSQVDRLLPTLVSRCQKVRFLPLTREGIEKYLRETKQVSPEQARLYASLSSGSLGLAQNFASGKWEPALKMSLALWQGVREEKTAQIQEAIEGFEVEKDRAQVLLALKLWQSLLRDSLVKESGGEPVLALERERQPAVTRSLNPDQGYTAYQLLNTARLHFYRNLAIRPFLAWLSVSLGKIVSSKEFQN